MLLSKSRLAGVIVAFLSSSIGAAHAQDNATLPGGASSLRENHGDWIVGCVLQPQKGKGAKACALSQELIDGKSRQRVLAIEIQPSKTGAEGSLFLPFGLALAKGVTFQIDDGSAGPTQAFRTCLPAGCLVPVNFDSKFLAALRNGTALKIKATSDGGNEAPFSISLKGFGGAYDRAATLAK